MQGIVAYNQSQTEANQAICLRLMQSINSQLGSEEAKVWHGHPVWFINGNPIVGYAVRKHSVQLLFWSGQSFKEFGLKPEGSFKAAEARYTSVEEIDQDQLKRWLAESKQVQWDYKNIVKRKGQLERLS